MKTFGRLADLMFGLVAVVAAGAVAAGSAWAQDVSGDLIAPGKLIIGTTGSSAPYTMFDASGNLVGFDIDLGKKLASDLGLQAEFVTLEFSGLLPGVQAGRFDVAVSAISRTQARLESSDFIISGPYIVDGMSVTKLADNDKITAWDSVCGMKLGTVRGSAEAKYIAGALPGGCSVAYNEYPSPVEVFRDLTNKRIDFVAWSYLGPIYLGKASEVPLETMLVPGQYTSKGVVISKKATNLAKKIDELLVGYRKSGLLDEMAKTWFGGSLDWSLIGL
jgi:ABC-type amino acid transport substrate-binding protein